MRKGEETRARILDAAHAAVLEKGFGATSIDELIVETGVSKSSFFYHFPDKSALAKALLTSYVEQGERRYNKRVARSRALVDDPLGVLLLDV